MRAPYQFFVVVVLVVVICRNFATNKSYKYAIEKRELDKTSIMIGETGRHTYNSIYSHFSATYFTCLFVLKNY